jgi:hypothetical protein
VTIQQRYGQAHWGVRWHALQFDAPGHALCGFSSSRWGEVRSVPPDTEQMCMLCLRKLQKELGEGK